MALDPLLAQLIGSLPKVEPGPIDWPKLRETASALAPMLLGPAGLPAVETVEDRTIPGPAGDVLIRIHRPKQATRTTLLFIHGGGWTAGNLDIVDNTVRRMCRDLPAVVVSCTYRLAPEHPFPAAFEDALAAAQWVLANAKTLGGDDRRVVIGGDSAGGNLAAAVCLALRDASGETPPFAAQLLLYPAVDLRPSAMEYPSRRADADPTLPRYSMGAAMDAYLQGQDAADVRVSPLMAEDLSGLPPALTVVLSVDPLHDEAVLYASRLRDAGVRSEVLEFDHLTHGFVHLAGIVPAAAAATDVVCACLRELLP